MWCRTEPRPSAPAPAVRRLGGSAVAMHCRHAVVPSCRIGLNGFTLIELLVVIVVISVLASLVGPMVFRNVGDAKIAAAKAQIEIFGLALEQYRLDNDYYPSTEQGLEALRAEPAGEPAARNWRGPYLNKPIPLDPWGRPYTYLSPGVENPHSYDVLSYGRDGKPGGSGEDGDIGS